MGSVLNTIMTNDLLFYGIIIFSMVGIILLFVYMHHKKIIKHLEEEIEFTKVENEKLDDSLENFVEEIKMEDTKAEIDNKIKELDGKLAIEKIMNEEPKTFNVKKDNKETKDEVISEVKTKEEVSANQEEPKSELEIMLQKMQQDLDEQKDKDAVAIFEQEQEEKSIISYKELLEKKNEILNMTEVFNDERFENEPRIDTSKELISEDKSLSENVFEKTESINNNANVEEVKEENKKERKKFETTEFISPIFGRREAKFDYPKVPNFKEMLLKKETSLETTLNLEPMENQMQQDEAFLSALKEFRKNLE